MASVKKLKDMLLERPATFKWNDLCKIMRSLGFKLTNAKRGSGRVFHHPDTGRIARWHEPHPGNEVKLYVIDEAIEILKECDCE